MLPVSVAGASLLERHYNTDFLRINLVTEHAPTDLLRLNGQLV